MLNVRKGAATIAVSLTTGIVPTLWAMAGRMVPREAVGAYVISECARSDRSNLNKIVDMYKLNDSAYDNAFNEYCELNPLMITIDYDGGYVEPSTVKYLTRVLVKNIAAGKLSLN